MGGPKGGFGRRRFAPLDCNRWPSWRRDTASSACMAYRPVTTVGTVYLVGAGPGDPGLITLRGVECLRRADLVLYDYLVNPRVLAHLRAEAEAICLGRHGEGRIMP